MGDDARWRTPVRLGDVKLLDFLDGTTSGRFALAGSAGSELTPAGAGRTASGTRVAADLRSSGAQYGLEAHAGSAVVTLQANPATGRVRLQERRASSVVASRSATLGTIDPAAWHSFALQLQGGDATATVTNARLGDPLVALTLPLDTGASGLAGGGAVSGGPRSESTTSASCPPPRR